MSRPEIVAESGPETAAEGTTGAAPVACTLTAAGLAAQGDRWERLAAQAMTGRAETPDGLRLSFRPGAGVEAELRALAAVENECCAWATWTVRTDARQMTLDVRTTGIGVATLHGMFTGLRNRSA
jgi:hypothetical protein